MLAFSASITRILWLSNYVEAVLVGEELQRKGLVRPLEAHVKIGQKVLKKIPVQKPEIFLVGVFARSKAVSQTATTSHLDPALIRVLWAAWMCDMSSHALYWLPRTSVLKRNSVHPRISPMRSVVSRLLPRVSQPARRPWLSRSRRLFRLFHTCHPPFVQMCPVFICYALSMAVRPDSVSPPCNAKGPATPTSLLAGVESSWDDLS